MSQQQYDEYGVLIRPRPSQQQVQTVDDYGVPIKKKVSGGTSSTVSDIVATPSESPSNLPSGLQEGSSVFPTKENPLPFPMGQPQPVVQTPPSTFTPDISNNFGLKNPTQLAQENVSRPDNAQIAKIPILKRKNILGENNGDILEGEDEGVKIASDYAAQQKSINTQKSIINSQILNIHQDVATQKGDMISPKLFTPIPVEDNSKPAIAVKDLHAQTSLLDEQSENLRQQTLQKASSYVSKITNDPTTAGLTVRAVLGDNNAIQQKETLDRGNPVAPSDMYYNDRQGLEALSAGLDENYKDNPEDPEYVAKKKSISAQFSTLIDKYPEFKHQQLAKIVAQQIIKDQKTPSTTGMAFLPPGLRAAKELGLSDEDIKSIDFDNLPIQTPLSSAIGAVYNGVISLGSGIARIGGSAVGMDNNFLTSELAEARRKAEERFADVSTLQGAPTIVDSDKNSPTYLQDIANPQAGKYNYNFHTVSNAISHGVGSLAQFIGGTRLIGGLATKIAPAVDATEAGMAGLMIGQGYEPYYQKANEVISDKPEDEWKRHAYALINGSLDYYAFKALGNVVRDVSPETINEGANIFKSASSLADVNRSALEKWTTKVIKGVKETAGETAFVGGAQAGSEIAKNIVDNVIGNEKAADKSNKELGDVLLTGAESLPFTIMIPVGLSKVISGARGSYVYKENIYNAGLNPETYLGQANKLLNDGVINKEQYDQRAQVINTATKIVNSIPADIELNHNQRVAYTNSKLRELALKAQVEKVDDAALEKFYNDQIQQEVANRTEILNGGNKQPFYEQTTNEAAQAENAAPLATEKTGTTNEAVDNVSKEAEAGTFEDKVRELYPALKNTDDAGVNDFIKENATDTPSKFINDFGQDKFNEVVKSIPTKELQNKLDIILDNNSDSKDVDILDKLISDRESEPQAEQQPIVNSNGEDYRVHVGNSELFNSEKVDNEGYVHFDTEKKANDFVNEVQSKTGDFLNVEKTPEPENKPTISKEQDKKGSESEELGVGTKWDSPSGKKEITGSVMVGNEKQFTISIDGKHSNELIKVADLQKDIARDKSDLIHREEARKEGDITRDKEAKKQEFYNNTNGFADGKSPMEKAKILKVLNTEQLYNGKLKVRKTFIEDAVANGGTVKEVNGKKRLYYNDNRFIDNLTKTEYDYADYLNQIKNKPKEQTEPTTKEVEGVSSNEEEGNFYTKERKKVSDSMTSDEALRLASTNNNDPLSKELAEKMIGSGHLKGLTAHIAKEGMNGPMLSVIGARGNHYHSGIEAVRTPSVIVHEFLHHYTEDVLSEQPENLSKGDKTFVDDIKKYYRIAKEADKEDRYETSSVKEFVSGITTNEFGHFLKGIKIGDTNLFEKVKESVIKYIENVNKKTEEQGIPSEPTNKVKGVSSNSNEVNPALKDVESTTKALSAIEPSISEKLSNKIGETLNKKKAKIDTENNSAITSAGKQIKFRIAKSTDTEIGQGFLTISAIDNNGNKVGYAKFLDNGNKELEGSEVEVPEKQQKQGIASAIYSYADAMGYKVKESVLQTPEGRSLWKSLKAKEGSLKSISEAYHKAKLDGSNPELVKAVEDLINKNESNAKPTTEVSPKAGVSSNSNEEVVPSEKDFEHNYKSIADITENTFAKRDALLQEAILADDAVNKPTLERINAIDKEISKMMQDNGVTSDRDLMRKVAKENISDFGKLVELQAEKEDLYKNVKHDNVKKYNNDTNKLIAQKIKPFQDAIKKEEERIDKGITDLSTELGATINDLKWGTKEIDEDLGDRIGDNKSAIFIKPHETEISTTNGTESVVDGLQIELVTVNPKNRGEGLAKKRLKQITDEADKRNLPLFIDAVPQEKGIAESGLIKLYEQYGFKFDGIHGKREPKPISEPTNKVENNSDNNQEGDYPFSEKSQSYFTPDELMPYIGESLEDAKKRAEKYFGMKSPYPDDIIKEAINVHNFGGATTAGFNEYVLNKIKGTKQNKQTEAPKPITQSPLPTKEEISKYSAKDKLALVNAVRNKDAKAIQEITERNRGGSVKFDKTTNADAAFETRDGKRIGFDYDTDKVARERFDFSKLKQTGKGSDRTVFDLGDGKVLKVAHTARGLEQNIYEGDRYLKGIVPDVHERGLNYVVTDKVPRIKANDIVPTYDIETGEQNGTAKAGEMIRELGKFNQKDFDNKTSGIQDALRKYGLGDVMDYDVLYGDFKAGRNWGYENGRPVHIDGGTFGGTRMIDNYKGKAPLSDPEFRDIYNKSKALKKQFGDTDKNTKFQKSEIKTDEGTMPVEQYVSRAKAVLEKLFPKAKFEAYDTTADYLDAGGTYGSKGLSRVDGKGNRTIMLDLQEIRDSGSGKTAFHEVIHPIVDEVVGERPEELNPLWNSLAEQMKDVKGFGDVLLHVGNYKAHEHPAAEGITELLTQISEGNISLDAVPPARKGVIIDLLNKLFEKLGLNIRFGDSYDFKSFATDIKKAFETGDTESLKQVVDKKSEENQRAKDNASKISKLLFGSDKADKSETDINDVVKQLRELGLTDKEIEEGLKQSGDSEADIKRALGGGGKSGNVGETEGLEQGDGNAITHAAISEFRAENNFEQFSHTTVTDAELNKMADKAIAKGYNVNDLWHRISLGHNPNDVEVAILKKVKSAIKEAVEKDPSSANLRKALNFADASDMAGQIAGRAFRARQDIDEIDVSKQSLDDFFVTRMRNKGITPETMTDAQKSEIQKQYKDLKDAHDKLEAKVAKLVEADAKRKAESAVKKMKDRTSSQPKKTHEEYVKERKSLVEQLKAAKAKAEERMKGITKSGFSVTVTPEMVKIIGKIAYSHVSEGAQKLQEVSQKVYNEIKDVFEGVTQQDVVDVLAGAYNAVKPEKNDILKQIAALRSEAIKESSLAKEKKDVQRLKTIKKTYQRNIDKLKEDLRTGKYLQEKDKPEPLKLDKEALALKDQYISIKQETQRLIAKDEYKKKNWRQKRKMDAIEALNIPRTAMSSSDFSAVLRQAVVPSISHPVVALKSMKGMFADAFSAKKFDRWLFDLKESPLYDDMKKSKVYISDPHDVRLSKKEEAYMNNLVERIPYLGTWLVKGSERAYLSYLNRMRVELYALGSDVLTRNGKTIENSPKDFEGLGSFVNNMTGRGGVPEKMELATPLISAGIFAPRLIASRLNLLGLSDVTGNGFYSKLPPEIRKMAIMDMTKFVLFGSAVLGLSSLVGDDKKNKTVEFDPRSSDFGKIRVGDTRYDIWGGFQQYVTFFARQIAGQSKSVNSGKMYDLDGKGAFGRTRWDTFLSFARGKASPAVGMGIDFLAGGRTVIGDKILYGNLFGDHKKKEITLGSYLGEHFFPMTSGDIYDAVQSGDMRNLFAIPATIFGISVQTFNDKK